METSKQASEQHAQPDHSTHKGMKNMSAVQNIECIAALVILIPAALAFGYFALRESQRSH
jgi:hypothetical protein